MKKSRVFLSSPGKSRSARKKQNLCKEKWKLENHQHPVDTLETCVCSILLFEKGLTTWRLDSLKIRNAVGNTPDPPVGRGSRGLREGENRTWNPETKKYRKLSKLYYIKIYYYPIYRIINLAWIHQNNDSWIGCMEISGGRLSRVGKNNRTSSQGHVVKMSVNVTKDLLKGIYQRLKFCFLIGTMSGQLQRRHHPKWCRILVIKSISTSGSNKFLPQDTIDWTCVFIGHHKIASKNSNHPSKQDQNASFLHRQNDKLKLCLRRKTWSHITYIYIHM